MCNFVMSNGKKCSAPTNEAGLCRYAKHNKINFVSENVPQNIPTLEEQITETDMSPNHNQAVIKNDNIEVAAAIMDDTIAETESLYKEDEIDSNSKLNNAKQLRTEAILQKISEVAQKKEEIKIAQELVNEGKSDEMIEIEQKIELQHKRLIRADKIENEGTRSKFIAANEAKLNDWISKKDALLNKEQPQEQPQEQPIQKIRIDRRLYRLCRMIPTKWIMNVNNVWSLAGFFNKIPYSDKNVMLSTYLCVLEEKISSANFNKDRAIDDFNKWDSESKYQPISESKIRQIVGSHPKYNDWKDQYDIKLVKDSDSDELKKIPLVDEFKNRIIQAAKGKYKREYGSGVIYEKQTSYYFTRKYDDPMQFLNVILSDDPRYITLKPNDCSNLLNFIKVIKCPGFDFIELDYNYVGFKNGIYNLDTAEFIQINDIVGNIQVRRYINMDFKLGDTPNLDKYMKYQFDDEEIEFNYFMLGRLLTKLNDNFDFMVLLYGQGGSGKSLTLKLIKHSFSCDQVGIFGSSFQDKFGASELAKSQIVLSDDMPTNLAKTLPKSDFLSMMSRGPVSCPVKGKSSIMVHDWNIPTLLNSNLLPNYTDISGEIIRRVWMMNFKNNILDEEKDIELESKILETEYPTFLHRCRSTYLKYCKLHKGKSVEMFCPQSALENRTILRGASNNTYKFIKDCFTFDENSFMEIPQIRNEFKRYMQEQYDIKHAPKDTLNIPTISQVDIKYEYKKQMFCKSCLNRHKLGCCKDYQRMHKTTKEIVYGLKRIPRELEQFHQSLH